MTGAGIAAVRLPAADHLAVAEVLADAFDGYPVMRHVLGPAPARPEQLRELVAFFVAARALRDEPLFGARDGRGGLQGAAMLSWSEPGPPPPALDLHRERLWASLGSAARARYEDYGRAAGTFEFGPPHWHLNMVGVRRSWAGRGVGRLLLDAVHRHAAADPRAAGVSLTTETASNVPLYEHLGYRVVGQATIVAGIESWGMFRPARGGA